MTFLINKNQESERLEHIELRQDLQLENTEEEGFSEDSRPEQPWRFLQRVAY